MQLGYFFRYLSTTEVDLNHSLIEDLLKQVTPLYEIDMNKVDGSGELRFGDQPIGILEINYPDDELFEEEIEELRALVELSKSDRKKDVLNALNFTTYLVVLEVIWQGNDPDPILALADPLWDVLFARYPGLLQVDNEGFYSSQDIILEMSLKI